MPPRPSLVLACALSVLAAGCGSSPPRREAGEGRPALFREISIRPFPPVVLGKPFQGAGLVGSRLDDSTYQLKPYTFGDAESIRVRLRRDGRVRALLFTYDRRESYASKVTGYVESLGPATDSGAAGDSAWTYWEDGRTRFEVARVGAGVRARMSDLLP